MKTIAITGAAGKLGQAVLRHAPADVRVRALDMYVPAELPSCAAEIEWQTLEIRDPAAVLAALTGTDAVLHLAAIPGPKSAALHKVFEVNVMGTFNVCQATQTLGHRELVYISSLCYHGYPFLNRVFVPPYLPVDEDSPAIPDEPYSLSKRVGEEIIAAWVRATGGGAVSLRYPLVAKNGAREVGRYGSMAVGTAGACNFYGYVDLDDAAKAVWLSLEYAGAHHGEHMPFFITADDSRSETPTAEIIAAQYTGVADDRLSQHLAENPYMGLYSSARAKRLLGYQATPSTWRETVPPTPKAE